MSNPCTMGQGSTCPEPVPCVSQILKRPSLPLPGRGAREAVAGKEGKGVRRSSLFAGESDDCGCETDTHSQRHLLWALYRVSVLLGVFLWERENPLGGLTSLQRAAFHFIPEGMLTEPGTGACSYDLQVCRQEVEVPSALLLS